MSNIFSDKRKLFGTILGLIMFALTIVSITYAYYSWRSSNTIVTFNIQDNIFYCEHKDPNNTGGIAPVLDYKTGFFDSYIVKNIGRSDTTFSITIDILSCLNNSNNGTSTNCSEFFRDDFKYKVLLDPTGGSNNCSVDDTNCTVVGEGNFSGMKVGKNTLIRTVNLPNNSKYQYYVFLYLDGNVSNPNVNAISGHVMSAALGICDIYDSFDLSYIKLSSSAYQIGGSCASVSPDCIKLTNGSTYGAATTCSAPYTAVGLPTPTRSDTVISFNSNASGVSNPSNKTVKYDFSGWYNNNNFTGNAITNSTVVTTTTNEPLFAKWTPNTPSSGSITLPSISRAGYIFDGWYTAASGGTRVGGIGDSYLPTDCTKTLYAHWNPNSVTVNVKKDNGIYNSSGMKIVLSTDKDTNTNTFDGTATNSFTFTSNGTKNVVAGTTYYVWIGKDANHKLDMVYTGVFFTTVAGSGNSVSVNYYTLTVNGNNVNNLKVNGSSVNSGSSVVVAGNYDHAITGAAITGYSFDSWSSSGSGTVAFGNASQASTTANVTVNSATITASGIVNNYTLTINPNSGSYNGSTNNTTVTQAYNSYYGLNTPTRTGYTFGSWTKSGSGTLLRGNASGKAASKSAQFTETVHTDTDGSQYTNYKYTDISVTSNTWPNLQYPTYSFTVGHTYRISLDLRINTWTNIGYVQLRHACRSNDYSSTGRVATSVPSSTSGQGWINYTMDRTWEGTTIASSNGSTNVTINPLFEIYTHIAANTTGSLDFDIKNVVIEDITNNTQISSSTYGGYVYKFGAGAGTVTANWTANQYTLTLNGNGATTNGTGSVQVTYNSGTLSPSTITLPQRTHIISFNMGSTGLTKPNDISVSLTLDGWYTGQTDGSKLLTNTTTPALQNVSGYVTSGKWTRTSGATVYARWNDGNVTLPALSKTGYTCKWAEGSASGTKYDPGTSRPVTANITYYADCTSNLYTITLNNQSATNAGTTTIYEKYGVGYYLNSAMTNQMTTSANPITIPTKTGYTFLGYYTGQTNGTQYIQDNGKLASTADNTHFSANGTLYAHWDKHCNIITVNAGAGISSLAYSGWTGTGTGTLTKSLCYGDTIDLSGFTPTYKNGYSGRANVKTSGAGSISGNTFTVGDGVTTITVNATTIETPVPTVSIAATEKIYGASTTALSASISNTYDSSISVSYTYYYDTSSNGSYANTQSNPISATSHKEIRYYKVKATATGEGSLSSNAMSSNNVSLTLKRAKLTPDANSCGTLSSTNAVYAYKGETKLYTAATGGNETTWPTLTPPAGKEQTGWFSTATGTDKVLNNDGTFSGTAVSGWVTSSAWDATADRSIFAQCQAQSYTITIHYNSNSSNGSFTAATENLSCTAGDDGTCTVDIPSKVLNSKGKVNSSYSGLSSSINSMSRDFSLSITSLTLDSSNSGNQYYAVYASLIPVYRPTSTTTVSRDASIVIYRNEFFTSTSTMNTVLANADNTITPLTSLSISILSGTQVLGLTNIYNSTTYTAVDSLSSTYANFPINQFYVVYGINSSVTFHYYNGSAVATTTADCMNYLIAQNMSQATKAYGTASVPSVVSSSVGANGGSYRGVAASTNSSTTVSSVTVTCRDSVYDTVSPGEWINYTPSNSSYTIGTSLTGYSSSQSITPNELTKWRVLRKNSNKTVDIISQYTSSNAIRFYGRTGYQKLVSSLNKINNQYVNTSYATHVDNSLGYINQTATISTTTYFKYPAPWTCSTGGSCSPVEKYGGGDTKYTTDYNLINSVLGTRKAYSVSAPSTPKSYWLASRYYVYNSATDYGWNARFVNTSGTLGNTALYYYNGSSLVERSDNVSLRPVVRLSSNISIGGGTGVNSTNAYSLSTVTSSHNYYALYTNPLTVYYPDTSDGVSNSNSSLYRNEYFSSSSAMANVIATTSSSITSASVSSVSLTNLKGTLLGITPTINSTAYETFTSDSIKNSSVTTYYAVTEGEDDATIYYNSNTTEGEITTATANASITSKYYCKTTNTQDVEHGITTSIPDVVRNSIGKYNTTYHGVSNSMNSMNSISFLTGGSSYYANYGGDSKVSSLSLGSYVSYTPSSTSYTTDTAKTGYTSSQTINPSELNLWRVLSVNNDGTVDIISEYTSSVSIYFKGQTAYQNITGYLNELAAQYENSTYTSGSRHFGYNGQTEYITDTTYFTNPAPWACSTGETCSPDPDDYEAYGGGDDGYLSDNNLVNNVLGTNIAMKSGTTTKVSYWTASRYYHYLNTPNYYWRARSITTSGSFSNVLLYQYTGSFNSSASNAYLRPIVKLKANLYCGSGTGASDSPCVLSTSSANNVTEYYYNTSSSSAASRTLYRNEFFTSASAMNTILSNSATGTSNITTSGGAGGSAWYGYATTSNSAVRTYSTVALAANSQTNTLYSIYNKNVSATFYYYNGSAQATTTNSGTQIVDYTASILSNGTIAIPSTVSSSTGPSGANYMGLSIIAGSNTTTTSITTAVIKYYAVYGGNYTASFTKLNNNVSSIGSTSLSCSSIYTTDEIAYSGSPCSITLPSITAATGYVAEGWFDSGNTFVGNSGDSLILNASVTYTARAKRLIAGEFSFDNSKSGSSCTDVQCAIDELGIPFADRFSYSHSGSSCTDVQCAIDELDSMTN